MDPVGFGVFATQRFHVGDYICQYKGDKLSRQLAEYYADQEPRRENYQMYVYKRVPGGMRNYVIDASPDMYQSTMGRNINHSVKVDNIVPRLFECPKYQYSAIIFRAKDIIEPGTELLYNYDDPRLGTTLGRWSEEKMKAVDEENRRNGLKHHLEYESFD